MNNNNDLENVVHLANEAQKAVIEAQGNVDPGRFQHAQNILQLAKQSLQEKVDHELNDVQEKQLLHVKELLRQLEETINSIK